MEMRYDGNDKDILQIIEVIVVIELKSSKSIMTIAARLYGHCPRVAEQAQEKQLGEKMRARHKASLQHLLLHIHS